MNIYIYIYITIIHIIISTIISIISISLHHVWWHYLSNATCLVRPRLFSTALFVSYG